MKELLNLPATELLEAFAAESAAPAAGSAAAVTAALAAALVGMVARLTVQKADTSAERLRARYAPYRQRAEEIATAVGQLRMELQALVQEDARVVEALVRHRREPAGVGSPDSSIERDVVELPLRTARVALEISEYAWELRTHGYQSAAGDVSVAGTLAHAAAEASLAIAEGNLMGVRGEDVCVDDARRECRALAERLSSQRERSAPGPA